MSVLVVAQSSSEIPEGLMNNPVYSGSQKLGESVISRDMLCHWSPLDACAHFVLLLLSSHRALLNLYIVHSPTNAFFIKLGKV